MSMARTLLGNSRAVKNARLSVCVPCRDMMHSAFSFNLCKLLEHNNNIGLTTNVHFNVGTLLVNQRETLVTMAREVNASHILWLDSDMMFPADTAQKLLRHGKPLVAANYVTRQYPHKTVAYSDITDWDSYVAPDPERSDKLTAVAAVGMGCMLTSMSLFDELEKPYFNTTWVPESNDHLGEDFSFCKKVSALGYEILIDDSVSWDMKHLGTIAFTHDMVRPRQA